jgi:hypothetical protein
MKRFVTSIAAGAMMVGSLTVFASTVASAAGVLTATPNTGLTNGQVIKVSGSGFVPNESVYVRHQFRGACEDRRQRRPAANELQSGNRNNFWYNYVWHVLVGLE